MSIGENWSTYTIDRTATYPNSLSLSTSSECPKKVIKHPPNEHSYPIKIKLVRSDETIFKALARNIYRRTRSSHSTCLYTDRSRLSETKNGSTPPASRPTTFQADNFVFCQSLDPSLFIFSKVNSNINVQLNAILLWYPFERPNPWFSAVLQEVYLNLKLTYCTAWFLETILYLFDSFCELNFTKTMEDYSSL